MSGLQALLSGLVTPGVHRWHPSYGGSRDVADLRQLVEHADWRFAHLDGWGVDTKAQVLDGLGAALDFPAHYGRNLDALADCLDDLTHDTLLLWDGWGLLAVADEDTFATITDILTRRAHRERGSAFTVLLTGAGPDADVPELD